MTERRIMLFAFVACLGIFTAIGVGISILCLAVVSFLFWTDFGHWWAVTRWGGAAGFLLGIYMALEVVPDVVAQVMEHKRKTKETAE